MSHPKTRPSEERTKAVVYKFECRAYSFTCIGESKRCWCSRWPVEHKPGVRNNNYSAIKHAETTGHRATKLDAVMLEEGITNYSQRIFLEALHLVINQDAVDEHAEFPSCYLTLINSIKQNNRHYN